MTSCISSLFHSPLQPCLRSLRDEGRINFTGGVCVSASSSMGTKASMNGVEGRMSEGRMLRRGEAGAVEGRDREEGTYAFITGCLRDGRAATVGAGARVKVRSFGASSSTGDGDGLYSANPTSDSASCADFGSSRKNRICKGGGLGVFSGMIAVMYDGSGGEDCECPWMWCSSSPVWTPTIVPEWLLELKVSTL